MRGAAGILACWALLWGSAAQAELEEAEVQVRLAYGHGLAESRTVESSVALLPRLGWRVSDNVWFESLSGCEKKSRSTKFILTVLKESKATDRMHRTLAYMCNTVKNV